MERIKFYEESASIENLDQNIQFVRTLLQNIVQSWEKVTKKPMNSLDEVRELINGDLTPNIEAIETTLFENLIKGEKSFKIAGLEIDKDKVRSLVKLPDYSALYQTLSKLSENIPYYHSMVNWSFYKLIGQIIEVDKNEVEKFKDNAHRFYVTNDEQKQRLDYCQAICDNLNKIWQSLKETQFKPEDLKIKSICFWDQALKTFAPSPTYVLSGLLHIPLFSGGGDNTGNGEMKHQIGKVPKTNHELASELAKKEMQPEVIQRPLADMKFSKVNAKPL